MKLHGLETEHRNLLMVIRRIKNLLVNRQCERESDDEKMSTMTEHLDSLIKDHLGNNHVSIY